MRAESKVDIAPIGLDAAIKPLLLACMLGSVQVGESYTLVGESYPLVGELYPPVGEVYPPVDAVYPDGPIRRRKRRYIPTTDQSDVGKLHRWVLEMWAYALAAANLGIRHELHDEFMLQ
eukprot:859230-Prorocentrum_minimum.AAC.2